MHTRTLISLLSSLFLVVGCKSPPECEIPADCDDQNACTQDLCVANTCDNPALAVEDDDACTLDSCDPATGVSHAPVDADDGVGCTVDACDATSGEITHTPDDNLCGVDELCDPIADCQPQTPEPPSVVITEFSAIGAIGGIGEFIELHNPTNTQIDIRGFVLSNGAGQTGLIRAASDPSGTDNTPVIIPPGGFVFGLPNPVSPGNISPGAAFLYGEPGAGFEMSDFGDTITLKDAADAPLDALDFASYATDPDGGVQPGQFPGRQSVTTQLDSARLNPQDNDDGDNWCLSFRLPNSLGASNNPCGVALINEIYYDFDHPLLGDGDDNRAFIELAGPGGADLSGLQLQGTDANGGTSGQAPNLTISAGTRMPLNGLFVIADGSADGAGTLVPNADLVLQDGDPANGDGGNALRLLSPQGAPLDQVGYGASLTGEGSPAADIDPDQVGLSLARDEASSDIGDNALDFHFDPTPTPGLPNTVVFPQVFTVTPSDRLATLPTGDVRIEVSDVADLLAVDGAPLADNDVDASFDGVETTDTSGAGDGCSILDVADEGRGRATLLCTVGSNGGVISRGDLVVLNPPALGLGDFVVLDGWTFTGVKNETDEADEVDFCNLQFPFDITVLQGESTPPIFGRIFHDGLTQGAGADASIIAQLGFGPLGSDPSLDAGWAFFLADFNLQAGNDDEYLGSLQAPFVPQDTSFRYTYRFSLDGGLQYTYCDIDGAGANGGLVFLNPGALQLGVLNVLAQ